MTVEQKVIEALQFYADGKHEVILRSPIDWEAERARLRDTGFSQCAEYGNGDEVFIENGRMAEQALAALEPKTEIPEGWKQILVKSEEFDKLMYWLNRCDVNGHLEKCPDLLDPWAEFDWQEIK